MEAIAAQETSLTNANEKKATQLITLREEYDAQIKKTDVKSALATTAIFDEKQKLTDQLHTLDNELLQIESELPQSITKAELLQGSATINASTPVVMPVQIPYADVPQVISTETLLPEIAQRLQAKVTLLFDASAQTAAAVAAAQQAHTPATTTIPPTTLGTGARSTGGERHQHYYHHN